MTKITDGQRLAKHDDTVRSTVVIDTNTNHALIKVAERDGLTCQGLVMLAVDTYVGHYTCTGEAPIARRPQGRRAAQEGPGYRLAVSLPESRRDMLDEIAEAAGVTRSAVIRSAIAYLLDHLAG